MRISSLLAQATRTLTATSESPRLDAELLLAHVLNLTRTQLFLRDQDALDSTQVQSFQALVQRRAQHEPLAYLVGYKEFWSLQLKVTPDTLIPRPETELLVECLLDLYRNKGSKLKVADLGTGSGAIACALACERPHWQIIATDRSAEALAVAIENGRRFPQIEFYRGSWFEALPDGKFDAILANPPYVSTEEWAEVAPDLRFEPHAALIATDHGLADLKTLIQGAQKFLQPKGLLLVEHGNTQGLALRQVFTEEGYTNVQTCTDLAGLERVTFGFYKQIV